jgi:acetylornithine deacetylase/succinyl-diaminopimelate desuccinylase-like protein
MRFSPIFLMTALAMGTASPARAQKTDYQALAHDIFKQLIEINTTDSVGSVTAAAEAMRQRLLAAGFPASDMQLLGPNDRKQNLVVRFHGKAPGGGAPTLKPILFIGHLDVVEARRSDWTTDPFQFVEKDGYYYGRGTQDMKEGDAILVTTFIRLRQEGYTPDRDLILALTADEEGGKSNGVDWLLQNHRNLIEADYVLNSDGGGVGLKNGKPVVLEVDATEKLYGDFLLTATNPGGHSSLPVKDNAIYEVADGLQKIQQYTFPFELNAITRSYLEQMSTEEPGQLGTDIKGILQTPPDPAAMARIENNAPYNATVRTTCVATEISGGHAPNALPQKATANVNCRILPGHSREEVRQQLIRVIDDPKVTVRYVADNGDVSDVAPTNKALPPATIRPEVMEAVKKLSAEMWPGAPILPTMATGASDGKYTNAAGMPTYAITGIALEEDDVRAHGKDERLPVESFRRGVDFYYRFVKAITGGTA